MDWSLFPGHQNHDGYWIDELAAPGFPKMPSHLLKSPKGFGIINAIIDLNLYFGFY